MPEEINPTPSLATGGDPAAPAAPAAAVSPNPAPAPAAAPAPASLATSGDPGAPVDPAAPAPPSDGAAPKPAEPVGAPEKYEFKAPEGREFDPAMLGAFSEVSKAANLTQEAAQAVLDKMGPAIAARQQEQISALQNEWREASKSDKEFGGAKLNENLGVIKSAVEKYGSPALQKLLDGSGVGNHPEMLRMLYRVGKAMSQDNVLTGRAAPSRDIGSTLYDNTHPR